MAQPVWLAPWIAWRYLVSKKKHGAVGVITWISVVGVAVATAATVCVLSVFNGFQQVLGEKLELLSPDVEITPAQGRTFAMTDSLLRQLKALPGVDGVCEVVEDRALAVYGGQEMPVRVKGVDTESFRHHTCLDSLLAGGSATFEPRKSFPSVSAEDDGTFSEEAIMAEEMGATLTDRVVVSAGVGMRLAIPPRGEDPLTIIVPRRGGSVNLSNPASSLHMADVDVEGIYQTMQSDFDKDYVLMPLAAARELLEVESPRLTALYIYSRDGTDLAALAGEVSAAVPPSLTVRDRLQQHESQFRMSNIEKWITFLLLAFILLIASFNLISSLAMLVIDKQEHLGVLHAMGASLRGIGSIFACESGLVTLLGGAIGISLGVVLSLMQQHWGLIRLGGDPDTLIVQAYPARLLWRDLVAVAIPLAAIGTLTALLTARFARSRM